MRTLPIGRMLGLLVMILTGLLVANGCQSTSSLSFPYGNEAANSPSRQLMAAGMVFETGNPKYFLLRPGMEIEWALNTPMPDQPGLVRHGKAIVGPDGTMVFGPYGTIRVAGMTFEQAASYLEQQMTVYVRQPKVSLARVVPSQVFSEIAWQKSKSPPPAMFAQGENGILPAGFQTPVPASDAPMLAGQEHFDGVVLPSGPPMPMRRGHFHKPLPLPDGPNEMNPVLLPEYVIRPPDVLLIESLKGLLTQPIRGQHLVRPDGTVHLGIHGDVVVAGKTLTEAQEALARAIFSKMPSKPYEHPLYPEKKIMVTPPTYKEVLEGLSVDVLAFNNAVYYVITDGAGLGEAVYRFPVTGSETVLDAISHINGLPVMSSPRHIWVARRNPGFGGHDSIYPVDWRNITRGGGMNTNWQIMPGDRVYVQADKMRTFNTQLSKFLEPIERVLGVALLAGNTVNSFKTTTTTTTNR